MKTKGLFATSIIIFITVFTYRNYIADEKINTYENKNIYNKIDEKNTISFGNEIFYYKVYENDELKNLADLITRDCKNKEVCEIDKIFKYVTDKPYENPINEEERTPEEVIEKGGDCDEKAYLMASLLNMTENRSIMVYTKDHAFIGVKISSLADVYPNSKKIKIENEYYYYAETTAKGAHIGWDNGITKEKIIGIYQNNDKKIIDKSEIEIY